jgi:PadR family transcriptional regulator PadR
MRRKAGTLLPLEASILIAGVELGEFHGYSLARTIREHASDRRLTAHGTLYNALGRMQTAGLLQSGCEDADSAAAEGRPRRRLYAVTGAGARALDAWNAQAALSHHDGFVPDAPPSAKPPRHLSLAKPADLCSAVRRDHARARARACLGHALHTRRARGTA